MESSIKHHALALEQVVHRVKFQPYSKIANALFRFNQRAPHVMITNEAEAEWYAGFSSA